MKSDPGKLLEGFIIKAISQLKQTDLIKYLEHLFGDQVIYLKTVFPERYNELIDEYAVMKYQESPDSLDAVKEITKLKESRTELTKILTNLNSALNCIIK